MRYFLLLCIVTLQIGCNTSVPKLDNVDLKSWKEDVSGCKGNRITIIDSLLAEKDKLKGLAQTQVKRLLGKPDQHQLYERSQKFFIYHLEQGSQCEGYNGDYFRAFYIRFNSLDQAIEFTIQEIK